MGWPWAGVQPPPAGVKALGPPTVLPGACPPFPAGVKALTVSPWPCAGAADAWFCGSSFGRAGACRGWGAVATGAGMAVTLPESLADLEPRLPVPWKSGIL